MQHRASSRTGRAVPIENLELQDSKGICRILLNDLNQGLWQIDKNAITTFVNRAMADTLGYTIDEMVGKPLFAFMDQRHIELAKQYVERRQQGVKEQHEFEFLRKDGTVMYSSLETSPLFDESGSYCGAIAGIQDITARKLAEDALRKSEEKLRGIISESLDGIVVADEKCAIIEWNRALEAITGFKRCDVLGQPLWEIQFRLAPDDIKTAEMHEQLKAGMAELVKGKAEWPGQIAEKKIQCADGAIKTVQSTSFSIVQASSVNIVTFLKDITHRKHAEEALRKNEKKYSALVDNSFDGVTIVDAHGKVAYESTGISRLLGYHEGEKIGTGAFESIHPDDLERTRESFMQSLERPGETFRMDVRIRHKNGSWRWMACAGRNMLAEPAIGGIVINYHDITERKKAEEALRESENRNRSILSSIPDLVFIHSREGIYLDYHTSDKGLLAIEPEHFLHKSVREVLPASFAEQYLERFERALQTGKTQILEYSLDVIGGKRHFEARITTMDGQRLLTIVRDITERKKIEEELFKSQKLESLGLLAGGIAHDFNNLMGGIFGYIDLALAASNDRTVSDYLSSARGAIDRARNLTGQLLTFAKGGAPNRETGDLSAVIRDAANLGLSGSNVAAAFDFAQDLWLCDFDRNQIGQVIGNVVINAQQAMPTGGTVSISAKNCILGADKTGALPAGNYVRICIADTGIGIPAENLQKIFDPFFSTKQKGSGLGLSLCHSIVKRHNGWIKAESSLGKGSLFSIYLPASSETIVNTPSAKSISIHRGSGRILVMDDEAIIRQSMEKILGMLGYSVECRCNGKDTLSFLTAEIAAGRPFAAIILDLTIPGGMGGKEAAVEIRKMNRHIPVFVASGYSNDPVMENPASYGFTGSICKPFTIDDLSTLFNRHLGHVQQEKSP